MQILEATARTAHRPYGCGHEVEDAAAEAEEVALHVQERVSTRASQVAQMGARLGS